MEDENSCVSLIYLNLINVLSFFLNLSFWKKISYREVKEHSDKTYDARNNIGEG